MAREVFPSGPAVSRNALDSENEDDARDVEAPTTKGSTQPARRISGRQRKPVRRLIDEGRKAGDEVSDGAEDIDATSERDTSSGPDDEEESHKLVPAKRSKAPGKSKSLASAPRKRARKAAGADSDQARRTQPAGEYSIATDNNLFNAVRNTRSKVQSRNTRTKVQSAVDDWIATYQEEDIGDTGPGVALAEFVNFMLRCCGCNMSVDRYEAQDLEVATSRLDEIQDDFKKIASRAYPLVARKQSGAFRKALGDLISKLVDATHSSEILYNDTFCDSLQTWLVAATSSHLRSFRHTATVIALDLVTGLCSTAASVSKSFAAATRQRDAETQKGHSGEDKLNALDEMVQEMHVRKVKLEEYLQELFDGVWIHRYRDADPGIRGECIRALGTWMKEYPEHYLSGDYLRYVGWILTDPSKEARLDAVKSLQMLYTMEDYIGTMQHFTERFKARLVEMAELEVDLPTRCAAIETLGLIDKSGLLDDDQRDSLAHQLFSTELRVRKSAAAFFAGLVADKVTQKTSELGEQDAAEHRIELKALIGLLDAHSAALDGDGSSDDATFHVDPLTGEGKLKSRVDAAVQVLAHLLDSIQDADAVIDYLLAERESLAAPLQLEDGEEEILVAILVAMARQRAHRAANPGKKVDDTAEDSLGDLTRAVIKGLPRLFDRFQTDPTKIADVLSLVRYINLDMYFELRMVTAYEALWDDVIKQFTSHSAAETLDCAQAAVQALLSTSPLAKSNEAKAVQLEKTVTESLRELTAGKELETAALDETEQDALTTKLAQLARLASTRDIVSVLQDTGGLRYTSVWTVVDALSDRGRLGNGTEDALIDATLKIQFFYTIWLARSVGDAETAVVDDFVDARSALVSKLSDLAFGDNATAAIRRLAFSRLLALFVVFNPHRRPSRLGLACTDEMQYRCASFMQAEIERYAAENKEMESDAEQSDEDEDEDEQPKKATQPARPHSLAQLVAAHSFASIVTDFSKAVRANVIELRHAAVLLAHVTRFAQPFDECAKLLGEAVRNAALDATDSWGAATVVIEALREAHTLHVSKTVRTDAQLVVLAKQLGSTIVERGAKLSIKARISSTALIRIHADLSVETLQAAAAAGDESKRKRVLTMFKVLTAMVTGMTGREALEVQGKLQAAFDAIEDTTGTVWDPQRAYARRLATIMSKDPSIKLAAKRRASEADGGEGDMLPPPVPKRAKPIPRHNPRPSRYVQSAQHGDRQTSEERIANELDPKSPENKRKRTVEDLDSHEAEEEPIEESQEEEEEVAAIKISVAQSSITKNFSRLTSPKRHREA